MSMFSMMPNLTELHMCCNQGSSERVRYFAERVLNGRSDQKNKERVQNAFVSLYCPLWNTISVKLPQSQRRSRRNNR